MLEAGIAGSRGHRLSTSQVSNAIFKNKQNEAMPIMDTFPGSPPLPALWQDERDPSPKLATPPLLHTHLINERIIQCSFISSNL